MLVVQLIGLPFAHWGEGSFLENDSQGMQENTKQKEEEAQSK